MNRNNTSPNSEKQCLKITQFKYSEATSPKKKKVNQTKTDFSPQNIPIRTLVQKITADPTAYNLNLIDKQSVLNKEPSPKNVDFQLKTFLIPRQSMYVPKPQMFNRYNYQNYNGYTYKNPFFPPQKYPIEDRILGGTNASNRLKNNPAHGTSKNLQIVFCEHKYKDFVQKTNQEARKYFQSTTNQKTLDGRIRKAASQPKLFSRRSSATVTSGSLTKSQMTSRMRKSMTLGKRKTTLSNYLQEFNTLEKLSKYMEREHKLNQKYLFVSSNQNTRTVLLDIVIHRFNFLKAMKKKARQMIFQILLGCSQVNSFYKINIHEYIKFNQMFVSRDADPAMVSMFIFAFLFKKHQATTKEAAVKSLGLLEGSAKLHQFVELLLQEIIDQCDGNSRKVYDRFLGDEILQKAFVDLILQHH